MLHFLYFFGLLFLVGALFRAIWSLVITPTNRRFVITNAPTGLVQTGWFLLQVYIVAGWGAFCAHLTHNFVAAPSVENAWLYYLFGGLLCAGAVAERTGTTGNPIPWFAIAAFIAIALFPVLALPWVWFLQFV